MTQTEQALKEIAFELKKIRKILEYEASKDPIKVAAVNDEIINSKLAKEFVDEYESLFKR